MESPVKYLDIVLGVIALAWGVLTLLNPDAPWLGRFRVNRFSATSLIVIGLGLLVLGFFFE
jgi:hypothetical protein